MQNRNLDRYLEGDDEVSVNNVNDENVIEFERRPSIMRMATARDVLTLEEQTMTESQRIVHRRGCYKWLPSSGGNDMVVGSWWFVAGSVLTLLVPAFPLISLYLTEVHKFWPTAEAFVIPTDDHAAVYALLVGCGLFFVLGSLFLVRIASYDIVAEIFRIIRAFQTPILKPLFNCSIFATDEVVASWFYFFGTVPTVPLCAIYVIYFPTFRYYQIALIFCIVASVVMLLFTYAVYPSTSPSKAPRELVSPLLHKCFCGPKSKLRKHFQNDWLIICWLVVMGCFAATVSSCGALIYFALLHNRRGIFDYSTGAFDCLLYLIGSMYYVAGSYPVKTADSGDIENNLKGHNTVMNPAGNDRNDNKVNMKKAQREKENAEREADEHWMHRSSGDDIDDENEKPLERKGSSSLGKNSSESHQKDTVGASKQHVADSPPQIPQSQRSSNSNLHNQKFTRQQSNELDSVEKYENEEDYVEKCSDDSIPRPSRGLIKEMSQGSSHNSSNHSNTAVSNGKKRPINPFSDPVRI